MNHNLNHTERNRIFDELQYWNIALKNCLELNPDTLSEASDSLETLWTFNSRSCDKARESTRIIHETLAFELNKGKSDNFGRIDVDLMWHQQGLSITNELGLTIPEPGTDQTTRNVLRRLTFEVNDTTTTPGSSRTPSPVATSDTSSRRSSLRHLKQKSKLLLANLRLKQTFLKADQGKSDIEDVEKRMAS